MDRLSSSLVSGGVLGALTRLTTDASVRREMFGDSAAAAAGGAAMTFLIFLLLVILLFAVMLLYSVYKIMPTNKAMHLVLTLFLGALWFIPALFYHAYNGYSLRK